MKNNTSTSGFGLIDSLLALTLVVALALISVPLIQDVLTHQTNRVLADRLWSLLSFSRQQAMLLGNCVGVCPNKTGVIVKSKPDNHLLRQLDVHQSIKWHSSLGQNDCLWWQPDGRTVGQRGQWLIDGQSRLVVLPTGRIRFKGS